ncbi:MAG TPA: hypothetical protein VH114_10620 [Candidatus Acidoferrum sp.]|jgi:hypothetical protein|nr:hypothetical protein [Candidatus Acidoferrum sp.]
MRAGPRATTQEKRLESAQKARADRPRARRYPFVATIDLTDVQSEIQVRHQTSNLSLFGCRVAPGKVFPLSAKMRIKIVHGGLGFTAMGKVAYAQLESGTGILFTTIEGNDQLVLQKWIDELRSKRE